MRIHTHSKAAQGVPYQHVRTRDIGLRQQGVQFLDELLRRPGKWTRITPAIPGAIIRADLVVVATFSCTKLHDADQSPHPASMTTVGLPAPVQSMCKR